MVGTGVAGLWGKPFVGTAPRGRLVSIDWASFGLGLPQDLPYVGPIFFAQSPFFFLSLALGFLLWFLLQHTRWGVRIKSVGENPKAADALGVRVDFVKYVCVMAGGAFAALGGRPAVARLFVQLGGEHVRGARLDSHRAHYFRSLEPAPGPSGGSLLFGGIFVLQYLLQPLGVPPSILGMLPYMATLSVLVLDGFRKDARSLFAPAMLGEAYKRGER